MQVFISSFAGLQHLSDEELDCDLKRFKRSGILKNMIIVVQKRFVTKFKPSLVHYIYDDFNKIFFFHQCFTGGLHPLAQ
ncbi:MAG: hypothetical protein ABH824_04640 [Nanoarchaeota archaeon]|nr:hypothetical protein [Nanoarchaeota archaeon]MBU1631827.1 hypothetical protein [Nanoarchaeota archaeon]MBU1876100.1 hypothetical protein [Nanoarchaeota archaeon]